MKIALVTLFPEMFKALTDYGISARAVKSGLVTLEYFNPREFTRDRHQTVDDRPYGGGPGMVMLIEPVRQAIAAAKNWLQGNARVIYLSPQGQVLTQKTANELALQDNLILLAGRYEGIDERLIQLEVDVELSIGDYVLSGGELPAMVLLDALIRQIPGALGHQDSADQDSFSVGLLDCPHYTRPEIYEGLAVPEVLLSGDHGRIRRWRLQQALGRTWQRRPELLKKLALTEEQRELLRDYQQLADEKGGGSQAE